MATQRYSVTPHPIETLLTWVKSGEIAIPEIQRPFVWDATKVRNLLDSLYQGYPVGYLIAWRNPSVRLKDGSSSSGKRILIDGQQRVTALMAALARAGGADQGLRDRPHPHRLPPGGGEASRSRTRRSRRTSRGSRTLPTVFAPDASLTKLTRDYAARNPDVDQDAVSIGPRDRSARSSTTMSASSSWPKTSTSRR